MHHHIEKLRKAFWQFKQPLTRKPSLTGAPVSDLFVWRNSEEWQTFFELIDIPGLFVDRLEDFDRSLAIHIFDGQGVLVREVIHAKISEGRQTVELSALIPKSAGALGTFCIFHAYIPDSVFALGSHIAERGYVSYSYCNAPLRAYVHGNLDAIARDSDGHFEFLGVSGLLPREYRLQYQCDPAASYEFGVVNPTFSRQRVNFLTLSAQSSTMLDSHEYEILPGGVHFFPVQAGSSEPYRMIIKSRLVMARPLVFRTLNSKLDVFHG